MWPSIPYPDWRDTCAALHLYAQIVGKWRLARTPWLNHSWHATLYVQARGLGTGLVPDGAGGVEITIDLVDQQVVGAASDGRRARFALEPMSVARFHERFLDLLGALGATAELHHAPNEVPEPKPFADDHAPRPWDGQAARRFFEALVRIEPVFQRFRTGFVGKASPVHLFWGSFDLAVTRFSGREAPPHPGGVPALPDTVTREAYSHEVSSAGFWPGGGPIDFPAFYSYAYPAPAGFESARVEPAGAHWHPQLREFILPYEDVRQAADPAAALTAFLRSTYQAAADLAGWPRAALECEPGELRRPRPVGEAAGPSPASMGGSPDAVRVEREEGIAKGRYLARLDGHEASMTYSRAGERLIIIDHTEVPDALRGRGVGSALVERAVGDARAEQRRILPLCPFARGQFERHPQWADVLR